MSAVFVDSSFWIARRDRRQSHYKKAEEILRDLLKRRMKFVTTPLVFAEIHAHFSREISLRELVIRDFWENPLMSVRPILFSDYQEALGFLRRQKDKTYSFCDAVSFFFMVREGINTAAAFDEHFRQFGKFNVIGPDEL